jgi:hypothetical protein
MTRPHSRLDKVVLAALATGCLMFSSSWQRVMNNQREELGFSRASPLRNAPPVLVMTTQVLGGFRGLIANALWIRAMDLQDQDKFFEMVQLADWITKLQPHVTTVWIVSAWNMSYNISVKFSEPADRWRWVQRGIELLRDEALAYNPHEVLLYRELAWHFQHKMGQNLDDAHRFYKDAWATAMQAMLGAGRPDWQALIRPTTSEALEHAKILRGKYKLDPALMKAVDEEYGPLEWRLPETHAIYWAALGKRKARTQTDLITLRRVLYQCMQLAFQRGRLVENKYDGLVEFGPNLDIIPRTNTTYEEAIAEDAEMREHIGRAHKNFLLDAVYFLYTHNRLREANHWLEVIKKKYPKDYPGDMTLDDYALKRVGEDVSETSVDRTKMVVNGALYNLFYSLAIGEDDRATGFDLLARNVWNRFQKKIQSAGSEKRVGLPPLETMKSEMLQQLLSPEIGFSQALAAQLRTKLGLPPPPGTNAPPAQPAPGSKS